jgi:nicotinate-nucleotide adenylyltransferase
MSVSRRVGVMGGTFDPIHRGHIDLGRAAVAALKLTRLIVLPSSVPPHRPQPLASSHHRFAMAAMTAAHEPSWFVSDLELQTSGPSYTTATLERLSDAGYDASELYFVVGADAFAEVETWKNYPALVDQTNFAVVSRPGHSTADLPVRLPSLAARMVSQANETRISRTSIILIHAVTADVSSTAIREKRAAGVSVAGLVDPLVAQHIERHGLYASASVSGRVGI